MSDLIWKEKVEPIVVDAKNLIWAGFYVAGSLAGETVMLPLVALPSARPPRPQLKQPATGFSARGAET